MRFLGTGAAEGIPSPFCDCEACRYARQTGGKEIRRRTMFRLDEETCIDMGADFFQQAVEYGDFVQLKRVLFTHTHEDHLAYMLMNVRNMARVRREGPLELYLTGKAFEIADFFRKNSPICKGRVPQMEEEGIISFRKLDYFQTVQMDDWQVTPLPGNHIGNMGENSANFLLRRPDGKTMYYGLDTGWYLEETFQRLKQETAVHGPLEILISECTFGLTKGRGEHPNGHLDAFSCTALLHELLKQGILSSSTRVYLTHINHYTVGSTGLREWFEGQNLPFSVTLCHDGMEIAW